MAKPSFTKILGKGGLVLLCLAGALSGVPAQAAGTKGAKAAKTVKAAAPAAAQALAVSGLELSLAGDSTLHRWEAKAAEAGLQAGLKPGAGSLLERLRGGGLESLALRVKVESLHSPEGKSMDRNMHKAMHAAEEPEIRFSLSGYTLRDGKLSAKGKLEINGVLQDVELGGEAEEKDGKVLVGGSYDLLMSSFGIPPPVMMLGSIKTRDKVTVRYRFELALP